MEGGGGGGGGGTLETKGHGDKKVNRLINEDAFTWKDCFNASQ